jgi:hypothetical protein
MLIYYSSVLYEKILIAIGFLFRNQIQSRIIETPIFIVSAGRSGSTLLRKFLLQTGQFNIPPETGDLLPSMAKAYLIHVLFPWKIKKRKILGLIKESQDFKIWNIDIKNIEYALDMIPPGERNLATIIHIFYKQYAIQKGLHDTRFWGDKTPYLINRLSWILLIFPLAKIIHIVRDPRSVILSRIREFGDSLEYATKRWKWSIDSISKVISNHYVVEIKFEDLILYTNRTMSGLLKFISKDLIYEKKYLNVYLGDDHFQHHRNLSKPVMKNKINEWRNLLSEEDKVYIEKKLYYEMGNYGYKI